MKPQRLGPVLAALLGLALLAWATNLPSRAQAWLRATEVGAPASAVVNKCVRGTTVTYTSDPCPPDSRQQALQGGSLSVLPAPPAAAAAPATPAASGPPHARTWLLGPDAPGQPSLKDQRMEAVIGR